MKVSTMTPAETGSTPLRAPETDSPSSAASQGLELRHLRYLAAVADAGTFTRAAERLFIAQPTISQQIRRLEQIVGTPLLRRGRDGVRLTAAGTILLGAARDVLSAADQAVSQARQAAGLGRPRLRFVIPADLPDSLAVQATSRLRSAADAAGVALIWLETALDAEFSLVRQRRADAGLGWLTASLDTLPAPLDAMSLGEFEPDVWIPSAYPAAGRGVIGLGELAGLDVIHGPRRASPATYDRWLQALRAADPRFAFTDPPFRHSLSVTLAFAATASRLTAVLTGPATIAGPPPGVTRLPRPADTSGMTRVSITGHPLTATAAVVWHGDLPRTLQQILFDTADGVTPVGTGIPGTGIPGTGIPAVGGVPAGAGPCCRADGWRDPGRVGTTTGGGAAGPGDVPPLATAACVRSARPAFADRRRVVGTRRDRPVRRTTGGAAASLPGRESLAGLLDLRVPDGHGGPAG
jgi:DNA-binding transcriptional LysR family regulator